MIRNFKQLLQNQWAQGKFVCVGLDPNLDKIPVQHLALSSDSSPGEIVLAFNRSVVDATKDIAGMYKPQSSYYEALGAESSATLKATVDYIHKVAPEVPIILDAKRADINSTNEGYIKAHFDYQGFDAITLHPYMGGESLRPFLDLKDKGIIVQCRNSNPGAGEFQDRLVTPTDEEAERWGIQLEPMPLYRLVAYRVSREWNTNDNCYLVVGATHPQEMAAIRRVIGDMPMLIPGIGAQGGDLESTVKAGQNSRGQGMIINSSRGILFASAGPDFAEAARTETQRLHDEINKYRS